MPKICYIPKRFSTERATKIEAANKIIAEYSAQGYELTLRQLYYQFVSRDLIPNTQESYKNLGSIINDARLAGLIDWSAIVDRTRNLQSVSHWSNPADIISACAHSYRIDKWEDQPCRIEAWVEKDALSGVLEQVCRRNDIAYFSCRGYTSQSELWSAAMRLKGYQVGGQQAVVLHLGDHDPSGIDMTRDILDRLELFAGFPIKVDRLALNMPQVEQYNPPPNPAKLTDSRCEGYMAKFGNESWELDALAPNVIDGLIQAAIDKYKDAGRYQKRVGQENKERDHLCQVSERWSEVEDLIRGGV